MSLAMGKADESPKPLIALFRHGCGDILTPKRDDRDDVTCSGMGRSQLDWLPSPTRKCCCASEWHLVFPVDRNLPGRLAATDRECKVGEHLFFHLTIL
jgi:hypothetical protein